MAKSTSPTHQQTDHPIPPPDWNAEAVVAHRAVWEIAAMAGNVMPQLAVVKAKKRADPEWKKGYEWLVRLMTNALLPTRGPIADHVYYDPHRSGNAARAQDISTLRQVRVEVTSAIEFLWKKYGESASPEGLRLVHRHLANGDAPKPVATEAPKESIQSAEQPLAAKNTAHRNQQLANATKEINRLRALVYILSRDLYGVPVEYEFPPPALRDDVLAAIKAAGFQGREGFGVDGVQSLLDQCFKHVFQSKK